MVTTWSEVLFCLCFPMLARYDRPNTTTGMGSAHAPGIARNQGQLRMANTLKGLLAVSILSIIAACAHRGTMLADSGSTQQAMPELVAPTV